MSNELTPGTVLAEENLASQLGISRTPLRAALQRLQHEEIVMQNGKNMVVAEVTERDVRDISVVRIQLEPLAIHLLAQNGGITAKHLDRLYLCGEKQLNALRSGDSEAFLDQDALFHVSLAQLTGNSFLTDLVIKSNETIRALSYAFRFAVVPCRGSCAGAYRRARLSARRCALTSQSRRFVRILSRCSSACLRNNVIDQAICFFSCSLQQKCGIL